MVGKDIYCSVLVGCLSKDNTVKPPHLLQISLWTKPAAGTQWSKCDPNPLVTMSCLLFVALDNLDTIFTAMVNPGATNRFMHSWVIQQLNIITVDILIIKITLVDGKFIDYYTIGSLYLKL